LLERVATIDVATANSLRDADTLTPFGVEARYPSDAPEVLASGEVEAIGMTRLVRTAVMILLQPYLDGKVDR
jgi:hypothetical protein